MFKKVLAFSLTAAALAFAGTMPAHALSAKECSTKYQAAKDAGTLGDMKWNDFRKTNCAADAAAAPAADTAPPAKADKKAKKAAAQDTAAAATDAGGAKLSAKECSALYQSAKASDALDGMKWNDFRKAKCAGDAAAAEPAALPKADVAAAADASVGHLPMKECSAKYQSAKAANTLKGKSWNDFRKTECTTDNQDEPNADELANTTDPVEPALVSPSKAPKGVKLPAKVSATYASESPGRARMHTCVDAYHANKDAGTLGGLKWIQKGGGFYSVCSAKLKGL